MLHVTIPRKTSSRDICLASGIKRVLTWFVGVESLFLLISQMNPALLNIPVSAGSVEWVGWPIRQEGLAAMEPEQLVGREGVRTSKYSGSGGGGCVWSHLEGSPRREARAK